MSNQIEIAEWKFVSEVTDTFWTMTSHNNFSPTEFRRCIIIIAHRAEKSNNLCNNVGDEEENRKNKKKPFLFLLLLLIITSNFFISPLKLFIISSMWNVESKNVTYEFNGQKWNSFEMNFRNKLDQSHGRHYVSCFVSLSYVLLSQFVFKI